MMRSTVNFARDALLLLGAILVVALLTSEILRARGTKQLTDFSVDHASTLQELQRWRVAASSMDTALRQFVTQGDPDIRSHLDYWPQIELRNPDAETRRMFDETQMLWRSWQADTRFIVKTIDFPGKISTPLIPPGATVISVLLSSHLTLGEYRLKDVFQASINRLALRLQEHFNVKRIKVEARVISNGWVSFGLAIALILTLFSWVVTLYRNQLSSQEEDKQAQLERMNKELSEALAVANRALHTESELLQTQTRLMSRQRDMFSIIAHELRTPAAAIDMLAADPDILKENPEDLKTSSEHLLHVIDDLRQAINPDESVNIIQAPFSPVRVLHETETQIAPLLVNQSFALTTDSEIAGRHIKYFSDAYRIRAILTNLIRNAVYHSEGTKVHLSLAIDPISPQRHKLVFKVEDDGKGIPEDEVDRLFEAFTRGKTQAGGTGVGLFLSKNWSEKLGGTLNYEHSSLGGACFTVTFNLEVAQDTSDDEKPKHSSARALLGKGKVLLVEDDRLLRKVQQKLLVKNFDAEIHLAENGKHGLDLFSTGKFDLIITDYFMPIVDGRDMIKSIRATDKQIPIIALTAATIGEEREELIQAGADLVLSKPLRIESIEQAIEWLHIRNRLNLKVES